MAVILAIFLFQNRYEKFNIFLCTSNYIVFKYDIKTFYHVYQNDNNTYLSIQPLRACGSIQYIIKYANKRMYKGWQIIESSPIDIERHLRRIEG